MPKTKRPRRGSMGYWPRKRAKRIYPRVRHWPASSETKPLGFAGYKAGMSHAMVIDSNPGSKTKGQLICKTITVLDCPSISVFGFKTFKKSLYGLRNNGTVLSEKLSKSLSRRMSVPKKPSTEEQLKKLEGKKIDEVRALCHTNPKFKKKPEIFEVPIGGNPGDQLKYAKEILGKEIRISDIFKEGDYIDVSAVTKGKGTQGPVKRFGISVQGRKCEHEHRKVGVLGTKEPGKIRSDVPRGGQMGFHTRTELNKRILKITKPEDATPAGGFLRYGRVRGDAVIIEGSVPGPSKRLIRMRFPIRSHKAAHPVEFKTISLQSKQGV